MLSLKVQFVRPPGLKEELLAEFTLQAEVALHRAIDADGQACGILELPHVDHAVVFSVKGTPYRIVSQGREGVTLGNVR